jgi:WD40 repeat protein
VEAWKAAFSPDGKTIATASHNGDINFFNVDSGEKINNFSTKNQFLTSIAYVSFGEKHRMIYRKNDANYLLCRVLMVNMLLVEQKVVQFMYLIWKQVN